MLECRVAVLVVTCAGPFLAAELDHSTWDAILKQCVNGQTRVDYRALKERGSTDLNAYVARIAAAWPAGMTANEEKAALINAYNALTVHWIVANYPVKSIWRTSEPFKKARNTVNGQVLSLDAIETRLRGMGDPRIHAALVCAARSCPPLRATAYSAARLDEQLDDNVRRWLADPTLNEFVPERHTARVSSIFQWYAADFDGTGGVRKFLARFAPAGKGEFLQRPDARIEYKAYDWGLNDSGSLGAGYSKAAFYWDWVRNGYLFH